MTVEQKQRPISKEQRFRPGYPCPVCGGHRDLPQGIGKRCYGYMSGNGKQAYCTRIESANHKETDAGDAWGHKVDGSCSCDHRHDGDYWWEIRDINGVVRGIHERITLPKRNPEDRKAPKKYNWRLPNGAMKPR